MAGRERMTGMSMATVVPVKGTSRQLRSRRRSTSSNECGAKEAEVMGIEFREKLLWKTRPREKMEKPNPTWEYGVVVGVKLASEGD